MIRAALILAALLAAGAGPQEDDLGRKIDAQVARLSDDRVEVREEAAQRLAELGPAALPLLQERLAKLEGEARGRVADALRQIQERASMAKVLPPFRKVILDFKDRAVADALADVAAQTGLLLEYANCSTDAPITLSLREASPLQALDEICRKAGSLGYRCQGRDDDNPFSGERPSKIVFQDNAFVDFPAAYVRHYRLRVTQVTLTKTNSFKSEQAQASLSLEFGWTPDVRPESFRDFQVSEILDDRGRSLLVEEKGPRAMFAHRMRHWGRAGSAFQTGLSFKYPEADARKIAVLKGRAVLRFAKEIRLFTLEKPAEARGQAFDLEGTRIVVKDFQSVENNHTLDLEVTRSGPAAPGEPDEMNNPYGLPFSGEDIEVVSESGRAMSRGYSSSSDGKKQTLKLNFWSRDQQPVKLIRIPCVLSRFEDEAKFELKDIPFPK